MDELRVHLTPFYELDANLSIIKLTSAIKFSFSTKSSHLIKKRRNTSKIAVEVFSSSGWNV
jgi:hypothetical protein